MCMNSKYTKEEKKEWLRDKAKIITAYKVVRVEKGRLEPLFWENKPFKRKNRLRWRHGKTALAHGKKYIAYYHLLTNKRDAERFYSVGHSKIIECKIPKCLITSIGRQFDCETIVAKGFEIVGENEYLD